MTDQSLDELGPVDYIARDSCVSRDRLGEPAPRASGLWLQHCSVCRVDENGLTVWIS